MVRRCGRLSGLNVYRNEVVKNAQLTFIRVMADTRFPVRSVADGTHTQPPWTKVVIVSAILFDVSFRNNS